MFGSWCNQTCILSWDFDWDFGLKVELWGSCLEVWWSLAKCCWGVWFEESLWRVLESFVVTFEEFSGDFWGDCDCQQDKLLVELDDCYCCACWRYFISGIIEFYYSIVFASVSWFGTLSVLEYCPSVFCNLKLVIPWKLRLWKLVVKHNGTPWVV